MISLSPLFLLLSLRGEKEERRKKKGKREIKRQKRQK